MLNSTAAQKGSYKITLSDFSREIVQARKHEQKRVVYVPCQASVENTVYDIIGDALCFVRHAFSEVINSVLKLFC